MDASNKEIETAGQCLLPRQLSPVEQLVLNRSSQGQTYAQVAEGSGYCREYIRQVGSKLWHELSKVLGRRVTKKNLHLVLEQSQIESQNGRQSKERQEHLVDTEVVNSFTIPQVPKFGFPSGPLPSLSPLYIHRPSIEELVYKEISQPACMIRVKAPTKMGKSSLLNQIIAFAAHKRYRTIHINFQEADAAVFTCLNKFLRWFCANISRQLNLIPKLDNYWDEDIGSKLSCKTYLEAYLLEETNSPLVLALSEVKRVFEYPNIAQDFLLLLRSWHEQAKQDDGTWGRLRLVVTHSTEVDALLSSDQSPLNVGLILKLDPFNLEQVEELADRYGLDWRNKVGRQQATSLLELVGGHPYLVNIALYYLHWKQLDFKELLQKAPTTTGVYSHYLEGYMAMLREQPHLASALQQVVTIDGGIRLDTPTAHRLESLGLIQLNGNGVEPSCQLYRLYFRSKLSLKSRLDAYPVQLQPESQEQPIGNIDKNIDERTHLATQSYFNRYLEASWQQLLVEAAPLSLILCKIDRIGVFDHTQGISAKDFCLQLVGSAIFDCVNKRVACVAHYDDQSFSVILPQTDAKVAVAIANNVRESIKTLSIDSSSLRGSKFLTQAPVVSLGVASTTPSSATSPLMLVAAAEDALFQANGSESYCFTIS